MNSHSSLHSCTGCMYQCDGVCVRALSNKVCMRVLVCVKIQYAMG